MKHVLRVLLILPALALGAGVAAVISTSKSSQAPVYTVAEVQAGLVRSPTAWVNRTVQVWAVPAVCDPCGTWLPGLVDPGPHASEQFLPVVQGDPPPALAFLRRWPLLGHIAPSSQVLVWDRPTVYRVQLRRITCLVPRDLVCAAAVLVDAAPGP